MPQMIFVNLPVRDLGRSVAFYEAVGFTNNPQFTDDTAACMVLSDTITVCVLEAATVREQGIAQVVWLGGHDAPGRLAIWREQDFARHLGEPLVNPACAEALNAENSAISAAAEPRPFATRRRGSHLVRCHEGAVDIELIERPEARDRLLAVVSGHGGTVIGFRAAYAEWWHCGQKQRGQRPLRCLFHDELLEVGSARLRAADALAER